MSIGAEFCPSTPVYQSGAEHKVQNECLQNHANHIDRASLLVDKEKNSEIEPWEPSFKGNKHAVNGTETWPHDWCRESPTL